MSSGTSTVYRTVLVGVVCNEPSSNAGPVIHSWGRVACQ